MSNKTMSRNHIRVFDRTIQKTHLWLHDIRDEVPWLTEQNAYSVLRAVLQALRDHLSVDEAADFASQLPLLLRGAFFEGWDPKAKRLRGRHKIDFLDSVRRHMARSNLTSSLDETVPAVLYVLRRNMDDGEMRHVFFNMPREIRELFTEREDTL